MTNQCNHGQLRRQCEVCDLTARLAEAERERDQAQANYRFMVERAADRSLDGYRELAHKAATAENERDELRAEIARLLGDGDGLTAAIFQRFMAEKQAHTLAESRLAALREAVEKAPHGSACLYLIPRSAPMGETRTAGCNCWKKSALAKSAE